MQDTGPLKRRLRIWRFLLNARLQRRSRMRAAVARMNARFPRDDGGFDLPLNEHPTWVALWTVEIYLSTQVPELKNGLASWGGRKIAPVGGQ